MDIVRGLTIFVWISIPTVMYGGYSLLGLLRKGSLTQDQINNFRAGHAHAGVLLLLALLYSIFLARTPFTPGVQTVLFIVLLIGVLAQSGGFFLNLIPRKPGQATIGHTVTSIGAALLAASVIGLVIGLIAA